MAQNKACSIPGCSRAFTRLKRGLCSSHYQRLMRLGDPLAGSAANGEPLAHLNEVVLAYSGEDCLAWPFATSSDGYGKMHLDGRFEVVSRIVCKRIHGPPPTPKHVAAHSCGMGHKACVAPGHIRWATPKENVYDQVTHGTRAIGKNCSKLSWGDVCQIRSEKGITPVADLAARYGVHKTHIYGILSGKFRRVDYEGQLKPAA